MQKKIVMKQVFNQSVDKVFDVLSKHATYNQLFWPIQVLRVKDSIDLSYPDGLGSVRRIGFSKIKPLQEQITKFEPNQRIEYQVIHNSLIKHHLGVLSFKALSEHKTEVIYTIELVTKLPLISYAILIQLKLAISIGMAKLAKSVHAE